MTKWMLPLLCLLIGSLQFRLWSGESSFRNVFRLKQVIHQQTEEIRRLVERNRLLDAEIQALKVRPEVLEERARTELGMIREGETFCVVVPAR